MACGCGGIQHFHSYSIGWNLAIWSHLPWPWSLEMWSSRTFKRKDKMDIFVLATGAFLNFHWYILMSIMIASLCNVNSKVWQKVNDHILSESPFCGYVWHKNLTKLCFKYIKVTRRKTFLATFSYIVLFIIHIYSFSLLFFHWENFIGCENYMSLSHT